jgi:hypothetical protein
LVIQAAVDVLLLARVIQRLHDTPVGRDDASCDVTELECAGVGSGARYAVVLNFADIIKAVLTGYQTVRCAVNGARVFAAALVGGAGQRTFGAYGNLACVALAALGDGIIKLHINIKNISSKN